MSRIRLPVLALLALAGCRPGFYPTVPTPLELQTFNTELAQLTAHPTDILARGVALVDRNCAVFFDSLQRRRQAAEFTSSQLAAAASAASAILAIASVAAPTVGYVAAGTGLAAVTVQNLERTALLTEFPNELQNLVQEAQRAYLRELNLTRGAPQGPAAAYAAVVGYARLCTLPQIRFLASQALSSARATGDSADTLAGALRLMGLRTALGPENLRALLAVGGPPFTDRDLAPLRAALGPAFDEAFVVRRGVPELRPGISAADYQRGLEALQRLTVAPPGPAEPAAPTGGGTPLQNLWSDNNQTRTPATRSSESLPTPLPRIRIAR